MPAVGLLLIVLAGLLIYEATSGLSTAVASGATTGSTSGGGQSPQTNTSGGNSRADNSSHQAFIQSILPTARAHSVVTGIPTDMYLAIAASESNWGNAPGNELFGIKGPGQSLPTTEVVNGQRIQTNQSFSSYPSVEAAFQGFDSLVTQGRYASAYAYFRATGDATGFIHRLNQAGYATDPGWWSFIANFRQDIQRMIAVG